jgi:hypothetical protein
MTRERSEEQQVSEEKDDKGEELHEVTFSLCNYCLDGEGDECHSPGCMFWLATPPVQKRNHAGDCLRNRLPGMAKLDGVDVPYVMRGERAEP